MGRAEAFAMQNGPRLSLLDGLGNGFGYGLLLLFVGASREVFGSGTFFGWPVLTPVALGGWYTPNGLMVLAPGAFLVIGLLIWALRVWKTEQVEPEEA
jgi:Na+-transporting NADH:ubiquinone oxidoreductase subunit D